MTDSEQDDLCRRCGQPKQKVGSGRLTEWIKVCSCNITDESSINQPTETIEICEKCGKRVTQGRVGSFTQWVFRPDNCSCENPAAANATASGAAERWRNARVGILSKQAARKSHKYVDDDETRGKQLEEYGDRVPVDRYLVVDEIGKGNAGTVFLCRDRLLKKMVAIKALNFLEPDAFVSFQQEARATSQLNHPNIVRVIDFGATNSGAPYMVLEYFDGVSLETHLSNSGPLPIDLAIEVLVPICDALSYAHERKLWHRDLKPSNILISDVSDEGLDAKLIDFGVAAFKQVSESSAADAKSAEKQHKTIVGTPTYMSPDQAQGRPYDARCEVYSLGCTLFEMLTGRPPFSGATALELLAAHSSATPPRIANTLRATTLNDPEMLERADQIVKKCLKKSPDDRYQSVAELKQALLSLYSEEAEPEPVLTGRTAGRRVGDSVTVIAVLAVLSLSAVWLISSMWINSGNEPWSQGNSAPGYVDSLKIPDIVTTGADVLTLNVRGRQWSVVVNTSTKGTLQLLKTQGQLENVWLLAQPTDAILEHLFGLRLEGLAFDGATLTDKQVEKITKFPALVLLVLLQTDLTDHNLEQIATISRLTGLVVQSKHITNKGLGYLTRLPNLDGISISGMPQINDDSIDIVLAMPHLKNLSVAKSSVTNSGVMRLVKSGRFRALNLAGIRLKSDVFECLKASNVERLGFLQSETVTEDMYNCFSNMKSLRLLDLRFCPVVNQQFMDQLNSVRKKKGLRSVSVMFGGEAMTQDWDILISN